jgi:HD superfamily phosphohydrolase
MAVQLCCTETYPDPQYQSGVSLSPLAAQLVRTPEFQRLRNLKQLGLSHYTFHTANHTRYEHSLGVAHWAREFAQHLAQRQPELGITAADLQTLEVAGESRRA